MLDRLKKHKNKFIALALIAAFALVGYLDHQDELMQQRLFCENVKDGIWPNYKEADCKGDNDER